MPRISMQEWWGWEGCVRMEPRKPDWLLTVLLVYTALSVYEPGWRLMIRAFSEGETFQWSVGPLGGPGVTPDPAVDSPELGVSGDSGRPAAAGGPSAAGGSAARPDRPGGRLAYPAPVGGRQRGPLSLGGV